MMPKTTKKTKTTKAKKRQIVKKHLSMHNLLDSLSFSGTVGRTIFVGFLAIICLLLVIFHVGTEPGGDPDLTGGAMLYLSLAVLGFAIFDATYVWLQHLHPLNNTLDRVVLLLAGIGAASLFFAPFIIELSLDHLYVNLWLPLGMAILLIARYLMGVLFSKE